ncbi:hypothetical protein BT96DRAFT_809067, partial [Gymnopus androsaceus JB14]
HSPVNRKELFNLRHAVACNVIEQIFGIVKSRWEVLNRPANFDMSIQARIPPALAALHNFILQFDPMDIEDFLNDPNIFNEELDTEYYSNDMYGNLAMDTPSREEKEEAEKMRDEIAQSMWEQYQQWLVDNGLFDNEDLLDPRNV